MRLGRREHSCRSFFASILETPSELRIANQSAATKMSDSRRQYSKREVNLQIFLYCIASLVFASFKAMLLILFLLRERSCLANIAVAACFYRSLLCKGPSTRRVVHRDLCSHSFSLQSKLREVCYLEKNAKAKRDILTFVRMTTRARSSAMSGSQNDSRE